MFSPPTPASSPLAHLGTKSKTNSTAQMFHPAQSSPLSGGSSPLQARRRREYKSQSSSRSSARRLPSLSGGLEDTPQKQFLRDRFKARCLERMRDNRARAIRKQRGSSIDGSSSDGFEMDDDSMEEDEDSALDDELYRRVMMNEERRARYSKRVSFERDFGSSIDPGMYEDMETLEQELTGKPSKYSTAGAPPPDELFDDELIQEYLAELEDTDWEVEREVAARIETGVIDLDTEDPGDLEREFTNTLPEQPSPSKSMYSDCMMSSPPSSPSRSMSDASTWDCPFCSAQTPRTHIACPTCAAQHPVEHAAAAWIDPEAHPDGQQRNHVPLVTTSPSIGVVMLCGAPGCDWFYAL